jgi:hypothetical protein
MILNIIVPIGNDLCFPLIGAYTTVYSIDYFSGSYLKYIIINGIRRVIIPSFNIAIIQPPYQYKGENICAFKITYCFKSFKNI